MKKKYSLVYYVTLFIIIQIAWLSVLGLWIARFVSNYMIMRQIGEQYSTQVQSRGAIAILIVGLVLLIAVSVGISLIFRYLSIQYKLTKLYDNFIANVTHELKTPLSSLQLYLETIKSRDLPKEKQEKFIDIMKNEIARLNKLINTILDIGRIENKKVVYQCAIYDTDQVIHEIFDEIKKQFQLSNISVSIVGKANCQCFLDRSAFKTMFDNLVDNSIKYSKNPANITINLKKMFTKFQIEYSDEGIGLPMGNYNNIFQKFYRVNNKEIPNVKGSGLGLFWVKEIIKYHGGKIKANSHGINQGINFTIEMPIYINSKNRFVRKLLNRQNS